MPKDKKEYIRLIRPMKERILYNIPLINLLYSRKVCIRAISRDKRGGPVEAVKGYFFISKKPGTRLNFEFMFPEGGKNIYLHVSDKNDDSLGGRIYERTTPCHPLNWYKTYVDLNDEPKG